MLQEEEHIRLESLVGGLWRKEAKTRSQQGVD